MDTILSKAVRTAHRKGYRVTDDGRVVSRLGRELKLRLTGGKNGRTRYLVFNAVDDRGVRIPILVHRLAGFQKFKGKSMVEGVVVRHKDTNPLNNSLSNILLGSQSQNLMDEPREDRVRRARHAASFTRKLSDIALRQLRNDRAKGMTYADLSTKYDISKSSISGIMNGTLYAD